MTSVKICVCVGSSCHLKGSYTVIDLLKKALREHGLEDTVTLSAAFCLGHCQNGVTIKVDDGDCDRAERRYVRQHLPGKGAGCFKNLPRADDMEKVLGLKRSQL